MIDDLYTFLEYLMRNTTSALLHHGPTCYCTVTVTGQQLQCACCFMQSQCHDTVLDCSWSRSSVHTHSSNIWQACSRLDMVLHHTSYNACAHPHVFQLLQTAGLAQNHVALIRMEKHTSQTPCVRSQALCCAAATAFGKVNVQQKPDHMDASYIYHSMLPGVLAKCWQCMQLLLFQRTQWGCYI